jgi:hypothetical protein
MHIPSWERKLLKKKSFGLLSVTLLALLSAMVLSVAFHVVPAEAQTSAITGEIVNPLTGTNDFAFNSSIYPVSSTFTVDYYVANVSDMAAWQIDISWNNTIINFDTAWIPGVNNSSGTNVFTPAFKAGATPEVPAPVVEFDSANNGYLLYGATAFYEPAKDHLYPVNVVGLGLLCSINFTVQVSVTGANILRGAIINFDSTNTDPVGDYSEVVDPSSTETQIIANNATLEIYGSEASIPEFTPWMIMPFFIVATLLAVLLCQRKSRWPK